MRLLKNEWEMPNLLINTTDQPAEKTETTSGTSRRQRDSKQRDMDVSSLAQASFDAISPFINIFDPGHRFLNQVVHSITKEDWELNRQWKEFKSENPKAKLSDLNLRHKNGIPFNPYNDIVRNIYSPKHVEDHINDDRTSYYTSGLNGLCLPYIDLDWHQPWQTDGDKAIELLNSVFPFAFSRSSPRGHNWFPKVSYCWPQRANETMDFLESQLKLLLLSNGILCDIEVKGTITFGEKSGRLGKLPFNCTHSSSQTNSPNDNWDFHHLEKFKSTPKINCERLHKIAEGFTFDQKMINETRLMKSTFNDAENDDVRPATVPASIRFSRSAIQKPSLSPASVRFGAVAPNMPTPVASDITGKKEYSVKLRRTELCQVCHESGDAFDRAKDAVLTMRRQYGFDLTEDHVLDYMQETGLYSGNWFDNLKNREYRVKWWMKLSERTFDPKKCTSKAPSGETDRHVSAEYVKQNMAGCLAVAQGIECAHTLRSTAGQTICTVEDKAFFLLLLKFYSETPNDDGTMPGKRFEADWTRLEKEGLFSRKWQAGRFTAIKYWLSDLGLLSWKDNTYRPGHWNGTRRVKGIATKWTASEKLLEMLTFCDKEEGRDLPNPLIVGRVTEMVRTLKRCAFKDRTRAVQQSFRIVLHYDDDEVDRSVGYFELMAA